MNPYIQQQQPIHHAAWERLKTFGITDFVPSTAIEEIIDETLETARLQGQKLTYADVRHDVMHAMRPHAKELKSVVTKLTGNDRINAEHAMRAMGVWS